jgi:molecular chaperone GrpE (heat shock protein)
MTNEQFKQAKELLERIDKFDRMRKALDDAAEKASDCDGINQLSKLLEEILSSDDGMSVFDYIINETRRILFNAKEFCERKFAEL